MTYEDATTRLRRSMTDDHRLLESVPDASGLHVVQVRKRYPVVMLDRTAWWNLVELNGYFTAEELEALVVHLRAHGEVR